MVVTISVIGPARQRVEDVASAVRAHNPQWRVLAGAGPDVNPTAVVAVVDAWDDPAREVVSAVAQGQGLVLVISDAPAPPLPGVQPIRGVEEIGEFLGLDERSWSSEAFRADAERADRVKIAIRLSAHRLVKQVTEDGIQDEEQWGRSYEEFAGHLRRETLRHGVDFPSVDQEVPEYPVVASTIAPLDLVLAGAAAGGAVAAGFAIGRAFGAPQLGLLVGVVVAVVLGIGRVIVLRRAQAAGAAQQRAAALSQQALALTTTVISRINVPRVSISI